MAEDSLEESSDDCPTLLPSKKTPPRVKSKESTADILSAEIHPSKLQDRSILVDNFIPDHIRAINELQVSAPLFTAGIEPRFVGRFVGPVHFMPQQVQDDKGLETGNFTPKQKHTYPNRFIYPDIHFAAQPKAVNEEPALAATTRSIDRKNATLSSPSSTLTEDSLKIAALTLTDTTTRSKVAKTVAEYNAQWETIIDIERKELLRRYEKYSKYIIMASIPRKGSFPRANLTIPGIADVAPPLQIGDIALLRPLQVLSIPMIIDNIKQWSLPHHVVEIRAIVTQVNRSSNSKYDTVDITWLDDQQAMMLNLSMGNKDNRRAGPFNVRFVPSTKPLHRSLTALDWLGETFQKDDTSFANLMYPSEAPTVPQHDRSDVVSKTIEKLNDDQGEFVHMVVSRTLSSSLASVRSPMVLTGPAGTGKTKTMLAAINAVMDLNTDYTHRFLVCTPSHTAADVVTRRLGERLNSKELLRLYDSDRPVETVPVEVLPYCTQNAETGIFEIPTPKKLLRYRTIVCTCSDAHLLYRIGLTNQQLRVQRQCLDQYLQNVYAGSNLSINVQGVADPHFSHLFIDEASQAAEPDTIVPLSVVLDVEDGVRKVEICLTGDPKQLSPAVFSGQAARLGLECSWMERLLLQPVKCLGDGNDHMLGEEIVNMEDWIRYSMLRNGQERLSVFLTLNYRGHPSFLMMPSALFYADKLHAFHSDVEKDARVWCQKLRLVESLCTPVILADYNGAPKELEPRKEFGWPIHFRSVFGKDLSVTIDSGVSASSWANRMEAEAVTEIVSNLVSHGVNTQSIGVMAPFRGQVVTIRGLLRKIELGSVNVGTVEDYQAVEKEVIVLSLTRSNSSFIQHDIENRMGLFGQPKRSNVAMTRAECLFIIIGNPLTMALDVVWHQYLLFCYRNGLYYGHATDGSHLQPPGPETSKTLYHSSGKLTLVSTLEQALRRK